MLYASFIESFNIFVLIAIIAIEWFQWNLKPTQELEGLYITNILNKCCISLETRFTYITYYKDNYDSSWHAHSFSRFIRTEIWKMLQNLWYPNKTKMYVNTLGNCWVSHNDNFLNRIQSIFHSGHVNMQVDRLWSREEGGLDHTNLMTPEVQLDHKDLLMSVRSRGQPASGRIAFS